MVDEQTNAEAVAENAENVKSEDVSRETNDSAVVAAAKEFIKRLGLMRFGSSPYRARFILNIMSDVDEFIKRETGFYDKCEEKMRDMGCEPLLPKRL